MLNILFLALAAALAYRFIRNGGIAMLRMMSKPMGEHEHRHEMARGS